MTKSELKQLIAEEMKVYGISKQNIREKRFRRQKFYMIWYAIKRLRIYEYCCARRDASSNKLIMHIRAFFVKISERKMNKACEKVGLEFKPNQIGKMIRISHNNVVLNGFIGERCEFHGNNVVGNKRTGASDEVPTLGNHVDVGFGAMIIGKVEIADDCVIGAGAVVTKSFTEPGSILVGVPARKI